jgi:hypothetical protein
LAEKEARYQQQIKEYQLKIEQITQQQQHVGFSFTRTIWCS